MFRRGDPLLPPAAGMFAPPSGKASPPTRAPPPQDRKQKPPASRNPEKNDTNKSAGPAMPHSPAHATDSGSCTLLFALRWLDWGSVE
eukprot:763491-Hanusia_phi.AAC.1